MTKWIVLFGTVAVTLAVFEIAGLMKNPAMIAVGFYGFGCTVFGILWGRENP